MGMSTWTKAVSHASISSAECGVRRCSWWKAQKSMTFSRMGAVTVPMGILMPSTTSTSHSMSLTKQMRMATGLATSKMAPSLARSLSVMGRVGSGIVSGWGRHGRLGEGAEETRQTKGARDAGQRGRVGGSWLGQLGGFKKHVYFRRRCHTCTFP